MKRWGLGTHPCGETVLKVMVFDLFVVTSTHKLRLVCEKMSNVQFCRGVFSSIGPSLSIRYCGIVVLNGELNLRHTDPYIFALQVFHGQVESSG